jgi:hypothetical protein
LQPRNEEPADHHPVLPEGSTVHTMVLYEAASGEIVHTHTSVFLPGTEMPPRSELERLAREAADHMAGDPLPDLLALAVDDRDVDFRRRYCVDVVSGELRLLPDDSSMV